MNHSQIGNVTELKVAAALAEAGYNVLLPFGDGHRYDLVIEVGGKFQSVQCKSGMRQNGVILFRGFSIRRSGSEYVRRTYGGDVDFFAVYASPDCYLIPVSEVPTTTCTLRVDPARNGQVEGLRWAKDYLITR